MVLALAIMTAMVVGAFAADPGPPPDPNIPHVKAPPLPPRPKIPTGMPAPGTPSLLEQALFQKLSTEVQAGLACAVNLTQLQAELKEAEEEVKRLRDKYEPASKPEPK